MLKKGIYENIINQEVERDIQEAESHQLVCRREEIDAAESSKILADYLAKAIRQKLEDTEDVHDRMNLVNRILAEYGLVEEVQIADTSNLLMEVMTQQKSLLQKHSRSETVRPQSGFRVSNLFTGGNSILSLGEEIRREIASADEIYFIVSFLKLSGVRLLLDDLKKFCQREGTRLRIITTTYCGATETKAVQQLSELPHTEIRISYHTDIERLHAKAYIFVRNSGMHTAYIGSSNLSKSAQTDGLEWNMRVTSVENPHIIKTALATFNLYWNSPNFEDFRLGGIEKFQQELHRNVFKGKQDAFVYQRYTLLPHQKQILDKLKVEREECGNFRNLIVAATGTGKTVISAFDYLAFRQHQTRAGETSRILSPPIARKSFASRCTPTAVCCKTPISVRCGWAMRRPRPKPTMPICLSPSPCSTHGLKACSPSSRPITTTISSSTKHTIVRPTATGNSSLIFSPAC